MAESQNIEYKESWRDEYLKWLCGFANAQGGTIYIGIDDAGNVVGVKNIKKLMEDIPNKIQSGLGIVADVNKLTKDGKDYPEGWTAETLMQPHDSIPYNPDIANVFYRAGYIETWGQGIQKICDECTALGAELPRYEILGTGIRVYFPALKSALIDQPETPNRHNVGKDVGLEVGLAEKIIDLILKDSAIKMSEMAEKLEVTTRTVEREMKKLRESGRVVRVGGKRYGHWEVL